MKAVITKTTKLAVFSALLFFAAPYRADAQMAMPQIFPSEGYTTMIGMPLTAEGIAARYAPPIPHAPPPGFSSGMRPDHTLYGYTGGNPINYVDPLGQESYKFCSQMCTSYPAVQYGTIIGIGLVAGGLPIIPYSGGLGGATGATSPASSLMSSLFPNKLPNACPAPTLNNPGAVSNVPGRILGRWTPIVGGGILILDGGFVSGCTLSCMAIM
jgi:hypothetical protein